MNLGMLPVEVQNHPYWCVHKGKVPMNPRSGYRAKPNDRNTFVPLETCINVLPQYDGLGILLVDSLSAVDIDHCLEDGKLSEQAQEIIELMNSYTEISPSGKGLHILFQAPANYHYNTDRYYKKNSESGLELYISGTTTRYMTVTGNRFSQSENFRELNSQEIDVFLERYMLRKESKPCNLTPGRPILTAKEVMERASQASNGAKFSALQRGQWKDHYESQSEADLAFCNLLAFWCDCDMQLMDEIFRESSLYRPKWDERHGPDTYGNITIQKAVDKCTSGDTPHASGTISADLNCGDEEDHWEPPIPFEAIETPDFPVESLPGPLAAFVESLAESTQTPTEMAAILSLGVLSTAFQSRYEVEITPDWKEPLCLYPVAIAPPGERKSAVISALTEPVYDYEATRRDLEAVEIAQNQTERAMLEKALQSAQMAATKNTGSGRKKGKEIAWEDTISDKQEQARKKALDFSAQLAEFEDKYPFRLLVDDTTPEKLIDIMDTQGGCITVASAEGGVFDALAGRYDRGTNFDVYLKGHAGDPITVDRIGRKPNHIKRPRLTMMLTIQPEVLNGLMKNATFRGRGLCGRFLYAICKSKVGRRDINPNSIPLQIREDYRLFVQSILSDHDAGIIQLSAEAHRVRLNYAACIEQRLGNEWEHIQDWGGKLVGAMMRIAALFHAAKVKEHPANVLIDAETVEGAVKIAEYLGCHAIAAYQVMGSNKANEDAKYILKRLTSVCDKITRTELTRLCRGRFSKARDMEPALEVLIERGFIKEAETEIGYMNRKQISYLINPSIVGNDGIDGIDAT